MELSRTDIISFFLVLSVLLNIYEGVRISELSISDPAVYARETEDPLGGTEIDTDIAREMVRDYKSKHPDTEIRGFIFSRKAFDNIFAGDGDPNSLAMYLVGSDYNNLRLILRGVSTTKTKITTDYDNHIFIAQQLCPYDCAGW